MICQFGSVRSAGLPLKADVGPRSVLNAARQRKNSKRNAPTCSAGMIIHPCYIAMRKNHSFNLNLLGGG